MSAPCPRCGAGSIRFGLRTATIACIEGGRLTRAPISRQRWRCRDCGHPHLDPGDAVEDATRAEVARRAIDDGVGGAAEALSCRPGTVSRLLREWLSARSGEVSDVLPQVIAAHAAPVAGVPRILLTAPAHGLLLDLLDHHDALAEWVRIRPGAPSLVLIDVDARLRSLAASVLPAAAVAVPRPAAARAVGAAAAATFKSVLRDNVARGRNHREDIALLTRPDDRLSCEERDDLEFWTPRLVRLRQAILVLLDGLAAEDTLRFAEEMRHARAVLARAHPDSGLAALLDAWGESFAAGHRERWCDEDWIALDGLAQQVRRTMHSSSFDVARGLLVFSTPMRHAVDLSAAHGTTEFLDDPDVVLHGRAVTDVAAVLTRR